MKELRRRFPDVSDADLRQVLAWPLELLKKYPGRFLSLHVKDEIKSEKGDMSGYESTVLGTGVIQVKEVLDTARKQNADTHFIIEQESYQGKSPIDSVKEDLEIMKKWGY